MFASTQANLGASTVLGLAGPTEARVPAAFAAAPECSGCFDDFAHQHAHKRVRLDSMTGHSSHALASDACAIPPAPKHSSEAAAGCAGFDPHRSHHSQQSYSQPPHVSWEKPPPLAVAQGSGQYCIQPCTAAATPASSSAPSPNPAPPAGPIHQQPSQEMAPMLPGVSPSATPWQHCRGGADGVAAQYAQPHHGSSPNGGTASSYPAPRQDAVAAAVAVAWHGSDAREPTARAGAMDADPMPMPSGALCMAAGGSVTRQCTAAEAESNGSLSVSAQTACAAASDVATSCGGTGLVPTQAQRPGMLIPLPPVTTGLPEHHQLELAPAAAVTGPGGSASACPGAAYKPSPTRVVDANPGSGHPQSLESFDYAAMWKMAGEALESPPSLPVTSSSRTGFQGLAGSSSALLSRPSVALQRQPSNIITTGNSIERGLSLLPSGSGKIVAAATHGSAVAKAPAPSDAAAHYDHCKPHQPQLQKYGSGAAPNAITTGASPLPAEVCLLGSVPTNELQRTAGGQLGAHPQQPYQQRRRALEGEPDTPAAGDLADDATSSCGSKEDSQAASPEARAPSPPPLEQQKQPELASPAPMRRHSDALTLQRQASPFHYLAFQSLLQSPADSAPSSFISLKSILTSPYSSAAAPLQQPDVVPQAQAPSGLQPGNPWPATAEAATDAALDEAGAALLADDMEIEGADVVIPDAWWGGPVDLHQQWQQEPQPFTNCPATTVSYVIPVPPHTPPAIDCSAASNVILPAASPGCDAVAGVAMHASSSHCQPVDQQQQQPWGGATGSPDSDAAVSSCAAAKQAEPLQRAQQPHAQQQDKAALDASLLPPSPWALGLSPLAAFPRCTGQGRCAPDMDAPVDPLNESRPLRLTASYWDEMEPRYSDTSDPRQEQEQQQQVRDAQQTAAAVAGGSSPEQQEQGAQPVVLQHAFPSQSQQARYATPYACAAVCGGDTKIGATAWPAQQTDSTGASASQPPQSAQQEQRPQSYEHLHYGNEGQQQQLGGEVTVMPPDAPAAAPGWLPGCGVYPAAAAACERFGNLGSVEGAYGENVRMDVGGPQCPPCVAETPAYGGWNLMPPAVADQQLPTHQQHNQQAGLRGVCREGSPTFARTEATAYCNGHWRVGAAGGHPNGEGFRDECSDISSRRSSYGGGSAAAHQQQYRQPQADQQVFQHHVEYRQVEQQQQQQPPPPQHPAARQLLTFESFGSNDYQQPYSGPLPTGGDQQPASHGYCPPGQQQASARPWQSQQPPPHARHAAPAPPQPLGGCDCEACRTALAPAGAAAARTGSLTVAEPLTRALRTSDSGCGNGGGIPPMYGRCTCPDCVQGYRPRASGGAPAAVSYAPYSSSNQPRYGTTAGGAPALPPLPPPAAAAPSSFPASVSPPSCACDMCRRATACSHLRGSLPSVPAPPQPASAMAAPAHPSGYMPHRPGSDMGGYTQPQYPAGQQGQGGWCPLASQSSLDRGVVAGGSKPAAAPCTCAACMAGAAAQAQHAQSCAGMPPPPSQNPYSLRNMHGGQGPPPPLARFPSGEAPAPQQAPQAHVAAACRHPPHPYPAAQPQPQPPQPYACHGHCRIRRSYGTALPLCHRRSASNPAALTQCAVPGGSEQGWTGPSSVAAPPAHQHIPSVPYGVPSVVAGGQAPFGMGAQVGAGSCVAGYPPPAPQRPLMRMASSELLPPSFSMPPLQRVPTVSCMGAPTWQQQQQQPEQRLQRHSSLPVTSSHATGGVLAGGMQPDFSAQQQPQGPLMGSMQAMPSVADDDAMWVEHPFMSRPKRGYHLP